MRGAASMAAALLDRLSRAADEGLPCALLPANARGRCQTSIFTAVIVSKDTGKSALTRKR